MDLVDNNNYCYDLNSSTTNKAFVNKHKIFLVPVMDS